MVCMCVVCVVCEKLREKLREKVRKKLREKLRALRPAPCRRPTRWSPREHRGHTCGTLDPFVMEKWP